MHGTRNFRALVIVIILAITMCAPQQEQNPKVFIIDYDESPTHFFKLYL